MLTFYLSPGFVCWRLESNAKRGTIRWTSGGLARGADAPPPNVILLATPRPAKSFIVKPGSGANEAWSDGADGAGF